MNAAEVASHLFHLSIAYVLAFPIGWDRERHSRSAGLRTFPLVAVASCGFVQTAVSVLGATSSSQARIIEGVATGMGFIGGGAILKKVDGISGTATAASLWTVGAVGAAVGYGQYDIALVLSVLTFLTFKLLTPFKKESSEVSHV